MCRLHVLLAAERGFGSCCGASTGNEEGEAMTGALKSAFRSVDEEILNRARAEGDRDGSCALVAVRIGAPTVSALANLSHSHRSISHGYNCQGVCHYPLWPRTIMHACLLHAWHAKQR